MPNKNPGGRPPRAPENSDARLVARCTQAELEAAGKAAEAVEETLSEFVRRAVELRVKRVFGRRW
jgi:uncharacterized protein (DUF1778 family)